MRVMEIKQCIIKYNELKKFNKTCSSTAKQVLDLLGEHRQVKHFTFKQLLQEHYAYSDNIKHDANLIILLQDKTVVAMACAEKNINGSVYVSSVHVSEKYRGKKLCYVVMKSVIDNYPSKTRFVLGVVHDNIPAVKCYTKLGFVVTSSNKGRLHTIDTMELTKN